MSRCGVDTEAVFEREDFAEIINFTTTTKQTCGFCVSVPMSFAVNMRCPSLNTQAERKRLVGCVFSELRPLR